MGEAALRGMIRGQMSQAVAAFIEQQPFFFIATASASGACDASFRGSEPDGTGRLPPAVKVLDRHRLAFPDYAGNRLYTSLGNLLENPQIGLLFIDFQRQMRVRINGRAALLDQDPALARLWPAARRFLRVTVEQVFGNCRARIPCLEGLPRPTLSEG